MRPRESSCTQAATSPSFLAAVEVSLQRRDLRVRQHRIAEGATLLIMLLADCSQVTPRVLTEAYTSKDHVAAKQAFDAISAQSTNLPPGLNLRVLFMYFPLD